MRILFVLVFFFLCVCINPRSALAVENPLSVPNNKFGIHILFPSEIHEAASLVNSKGGDWGYVTIPIQTADKDLEKWQKFMDDAGSLHVIPLVRLATEGDYFNTKVWRKPTAEDVLDFANFLSSLRWPTKNRYIIVFNEVNRADEWGGNPNPSEYAGILRYASDLFKSKNPDFFIISAGLDNAAATIPQVAINEYEFIETMVVSFPDVFEQVDGLGSHSYPNPAFSQPPTKQDRVSIATFQHENQLLKSLINKELPVFITETGWSKKNLSDGTIENYYREAFSSVWNDSSIVAITPFLFRANMGPFVEFSFLLENGSPSSQYTVLKDMQKIKGTPSLLPEILGDESIQIPLTTKDFSNHSEPLQNTTRIPQPLKIAFKWIMKL